MVRRVGKGRDALSCRHVPSTLPVSTLLWIVRLYDAGGVRRPRLRKLGSASSRAALRGAAALAARPRAPCPSPRSGPALQTF
ncbi:hypothetical protein EVAR_16723_1 [Eumeta japonica]|uniref:Uncharacterized protein n=1 Tax=Eumeta variegata TaxID=151549 RepID=A0A4C1V664_EUMVA|nr:hypothetical protein EVAR_16723_1 [Eumeta japonica]